MRVMLYGTSQIQHVKQLFEKNSIEVVGLPDTSLMKSKLLKTWCFLKSIKNVDAIYKVYTDTDLNWYFLLARLAGKKTITHWIGTDVLVAKKKKKSYITKLGMWATDVHLACSSLLKDELNELGINSYEIPIVPTKMFNDSSLMPKKHSVLVYAPEGKELFYGMEYVKHLAIEYPEIQFHIVANSRDSLSMKNVIFHGKLSLDEMNEIYDQISILFRFPEHDGLSLMLLEALAKGKYVIYPYKFPYVNTPETRELDDVKDCFSNIVNNLPKINYEGSKYVREIYNDKRIFNLYAKVLEAI